MMRERGRSDIEGLSLGLWLTSIECSCIGRSFGAGEMLAVNESGFHGIKNLLGMSRSCSKPALLHISVQECDA